MKTEQEQIKAIKQIIDERVETTLGQVQGRHGNVIKTVDTIIIARDIVNAGYGDVSEYKAEIERLKANGYRSIMYAFENNRDKIVENIQTEIDDYKQSIKQAQIDILNKAKERLDSAPNGWAYTTYIDELIKEVQNGKDKG